MLKLALSAAAVATAAAAAADSPAAEFQRFVERYGKRYESETEEHYRLGVFAANLELIRERNALGAETHGVNEFADLTPEEFRMLYLNYRPSTSTSRDEAEEADIPPTAAPDASSINWANKGATTAVKNQGQCGSCWAFSATEQIESNYYLAKGSLPTLSPQQIVSCDSSSYGCNGGWTEHAYDYVQSAGGLESESAYPYTSGTSGLAGSCNFDSSKIAASIDGYKTISSSASGESKMLTQIASSPMSICVDADTWQTYSSGVVTASSCGTSVDHCVQLVGYESSGNYWIVRNSWGTSWGQGGYIYVEEGDNACAIASDATVATIGSGPTPADDDTPAPADDDDYTPPADDDDYTPPADDDDYTPTPADDDDYTPPADDDDNWLDDDFNFDDDVWADDDDGAADDDDDWGFDDDGDDGGWLDDDGGWGDDDGGWGDDDYWMALSPQERKAAAAALPPKHRAALKAKVLSRKARRSS